MTPELVKTNKYLSWLLRHGAREEGLLIDEAGWISLEDVIRVVGLTAEQLERLIAKDPKHRFQMENDRIRACQGHGSESGVSCDGLEASWTPYASDEPLWHGTSVDTLPGIAQEGILPMARTHVHCAPFRDSAVGKRADVHLMLEISPLKVREAGLGLFVAMNGVVLARRIPREAIVGLTPLTKRARKMASDFLNLLGLTGSENNEVNHTHGREYAPTPSNRSD